MINILNKVEDHQNHVSWIYFTNVHNMGESRNCLIQPSRHTHFRKSTLIKSFNMTCRWIDNVFHCLIFIR